MTGGRRDGPDGEEKGSLWPGGVSPCRCRYRGMSDELRLRQEIRRAIDEYARLELAPRFDPENPRVRLHEATFGSEEIWEAVDSLLSTRVTLGEKVRRFEAEFARRVRCPHAVMVNSGSSANLLALSALSNPVTAGRLGEGDEVIVPALSWSTSVWPIIQCGLVPVLVDIDPRTWNLDPARAAEAIGARTRAILAVHVYGNPCDMASLCELAGRHDLLLIEDACEAQGASFGDRGVGSFGRVATFSFYFSHHMTTLEGGMCITPDGELAELLRILRAHGWVRETANPRKYTEEYPQIDPRFLFVNVGYNLRPTELQGGFGLRQLEKVEEFVARRTENARSWREALAPWRDLLEPQAETPGGVHSWFGFPLAVRDAAPFDAGALRRFLEERGIETRPIIAGNMARQPALRLHRHRVAGDLEHADWIMRSGLAFGNHQAIGPQARDYVTSVIREFLSVHGRAS